MRTAALILFAALVPVVGCGKPTAPAEPGEGGVSLSSDRDRLQGVWGVVWMDSGNGATEADVAKLVSTPQEKENLARELDQVRQGRIEFKGDRMIFDWIDGREEFKFAIDEASNPKGLILTSGSRAANPGSAPASTRRDKAPRASETFEWIYKFEGDALVVAYMKGGKRPMEFKGRRYVEPEPGEPIVPMISVVTLKKTDVPAPSRPATTKPTKFASTKK